MPVFRWQGSRRTASRAHPLGIALGLVVGKATGVFCATAVGIKLGLPTPEGAKWSQIFGVALLAGIGFTMSLFIGMLAFPEPSHAADIRLGVLIGSVVSAIAGYVVLRTASRTGASAA